MAYIGNVPAETYSNTVKDTFSGDGSTVGFTLSVPSTTNNVRVVVENVVQDPTVAYSVSGTTLTFTSAPPSGTNNIYVVHLGPAVQTVQPPTELSGNFTLTGAWTQSGNLTVDTDTLFVNASTNRVGVGTTTPTVDLDVDGTIKATTVQAATVQAATVSNAAGTGPATLTGQSAAKIWANLNGTGTIALRDSFNVSSVTDNAVGDYTFNFTNAMSAADYAVSGSVNHNRATGFNRLVCPIGTPTTSAIAVATALASTAAKQDVSDAMVSFHGDLA